MDYLFLNKIKSPEDIKNLNSEQIKRLCVEIRDCMLNVVSKNGGHLASNLGVVELTVALHKVFNAPTDSIIFDVGHQCYPHKLLTGRYEIFKTLRQSGGISGFMRPEESKYDPVVTGHSSTSISTAYGILKGNSLLGKSDKVVAVIGDGALTGGMVYEALNNVGKDKSNLIIVLNDNRMSISNNVGALARQLTMIRTRPSYNKIKQSAELFVEKIPFIGKKVHKSLSRSKSRIKSAIYQGNIFEGLGLQYMGPVDGHNVEKLECILNAAKDQKRPVLIHVITKKGKGYKFSEENPGIYHGVSEFDRKIGVQQNNATSFSAVFGKTMCELAEKDNKICAITAAMGNGTGLDEFSLKYSNRFFDVGIAEEHAVTFSAGLAVAGMKPVFAVYSSFLQRSYDQIIHDCAISNLPVTFCIDRAGIVGSDGETHNGIFDVSFLTSIPNVKVFSPSYYTDLKQMLKNRLSNPVGVVAIRYPKGTEPECLKNYVYNGKAWDKFFNGNIAVVSYGTEFAECFKIAKELNNKVAVYKLNEISNLNNSLVNELLQKEKIIMVEESFAEGSIAQKLSLKLIENGYNGKFKSVAVNGFLSHSTVNEAKKKCNLDYDSLKKIICEELN